jgi:hypothetical protein
VADPIVVDDVLLDRMTDRERAGWLTFARALRQHVARAVAAELDYAAIPHALLHALGIPAYPLDALAGARRCGLNGFHRDELAGVDWLCLLPLGHRAAGELLHGWQRPHVAPVIADAVADGIRPELDLVDVELVDVIVDHYVEPGEFVSDAASAHRLRQL